MGKGTVSDMAKETVRDIFSQILRVKKIVNELRELSREKKPEFKRIHILEAINNALKMIRFPEEISNIKYNIEAAGDIEVYADKHQLEQVFINLFTNAVEAMEGHGGLLNIKIDTVDDYVQIKISDTGRGILPEDIPKVFDPFFTTKEDGTCLGLAIVNCIIISHKGKIAVDSEPDKGATFTITLPC